MAAVQETVEQVRRVGADQFDARQQPTHHHLYLRFFRVADADDRLLDGICRIFGDREPGACRRQQRDTAGQAKLERCCRVGVHECLLDRGGVGRMRSNDRGQTVVDLDKTQRGRCLGLTGNPAIRDVAETRPRHFDHAPSG